MTAISGPFGNFERCTPGAILNSLHALGIPVSTVDDLIVGSDAVRYRNESLFARYKWFDGIDMPLFNFDDVKLHHLLRDREGNFPLILSPHDTPGIIIQGHAANPTVHETIRRCLTNYMDDEFYKLHQNAGAFFLGGRI